MSTEAEVVAAAQEKVFKYWFKKSTTENHKHKNSSARGVYIAKRIYLTVQKRAKDENSKPKDTSLRTEAIKNYEQIGEDVKKIADEIAAIMIKIVKKIIRNSEIKRETLTNLGKQINNLIKLDCIKEYMNQNKIKVGLGLSIITTQQLKKALGKETSREDVKFNSIFYKKGDIKQGLRSSGDAVISYIKLNCKGKENDINDKKVTEIIGEVQKTAKEHKLKGFNSKILIKANFRQCLKERREKHNDFLPNVKISDEQQNRKNFLGIQKNMNKNPQINKNDDGKTSRKKIFDKESNIKFGAKLDIKKEDSKTQKVGAKPDIKKESSETQKESFFTGRTTRKNTSKNSQSQPNLTTNNENTSNVETFNGISEQTVGKIIDKQEHNEKITVDEICELLKFLGGSRGDKASRDIFIENTISIWWENNKEKMVKTQMQQLSNTLKLTGPNLGIDAFKSKTCKDMVTFCTK